MARKALAKVPKYFYEEVKSSLPPHKAESYGDFVYAVVEDGPYIAGHPLDDFSKALKGIYHCSIAV